MKTFAVLTLAMAGCASNKGKNTVSSRAAVDASRVIQGK